jgi:hypothetical protein
VKLSYGFLRRLEEEGCNVNIGADINDILYLDEREREIKEKMEEDALKKSRKPRPRDIIDIEELKNRQLKKYFEYLKEQQNKKDNDTLSVQCDKVKSSQYEYEVGTGID